MYRGLRQCCIGSLQRRSGKSWVSKAKQCLAGTERTRRVADNCCARQRAHRAARNVPRRISSSGMALTAPRTPTSCGRGGTRSCARRQLAIVGPGGRLGGGGGGGKGVHERKFSSLFLGLTGRRRVRSPWRCRATCRLGCSMGALTFEDLCRQFFILIAFLLIHIIIQTLDILLYVQNSKFHFLSLQNNFRIVYESNLESSSQQPC